MERNYQKEYALSMKKVTELQELVFAYQAMYDDAKTKLKQYEDSNNETQDIGEVNNVEEAQYQEDE